MTCIILILAGLFEIVWAVGLKYTHGFTRLMPSLVTVGGMLISFWLLAVAMKTLPLGTAYAVWVGIGTVGAFVAGENEDDTGHDDSYLRGVVPGLMRRRQWPMPPLPMANAAMWRRAQQRAVPSRQKL